MRVLFLHTNRQDYLADGIFHGLRTLLGEDCVDVPRYDCMYAPLENELKSKLRGNGFTLYGLLPDLPLQAQRYYWQSQLNTFDVIVIANIWRQWIDLWNYRDLFKNKKIVVLDGEDIPYLFPYGSYGSHFKKHPFFLFTPLKKAYYFKRELYDGYVSRSMDRIFGTSPLFEMSLPTNVFPISFSIPKEKITRQETGCQKLFQTHVVDEEIGKLLLETKFSSTGSDLAFFKEEDLYYHDMRTSKFGITTKRAGWDCLRHYEIAASGSILCFRDLHMKPPKCAPQGLDDSNSISYTSYSHLMNQIEHLDNERYHQLKNASYDWIHQNTTETKATYLLENVIK